MNDDVILFLQELRKWSRGQTCRKKISILGLGLFTWIFFYLGKMLIAETSKILILLVEHALIIELIQILLILSVGR